MNRETGALAFTGRWTGAMLGRKIRIENDRKIFAVALPGVGGSGAP